MMLPYFRQCDSVVYTAKCFYDIAEKKNKSSRISLTWKTTKCWSHMHSKKLHLHHNYVWFMLIMCSSKNKKQQKQPANWKTNKQKLDIISE